MSKEELKVEWRYRYEERLGILCGNDEPTDEQKQIARKEADEACAKLGGVDWDKFEKDIAGAFEKTDEPLL